MILDIKKDKRSKGAFFHKGLHGFNITKTKQQALRDITDDCEYNYVSNEETVLKLNEYKQIHIPFNI